MRTVHASEYRTITGRTLDLDPSNGHVQNDPAAAALWSREYRAGWEPRV